MYFSIPFDFYIKWKITFCNNHSYIYGMAIALKHFNDIKEYISKHADGLDEIL